MIARLEHASVAEVSKPPAPAIIQSFARRALCENPVPKTVWLSQCGEMRANLRDPWRPFIAEQVISVHEPGFVWLARTQAARSYTRTSSTATWAAKVFSKCACSAHCDWRGPPDRRPAGAS